MKQNGRPMLNERITQRICTSSVVGMCSYGDRCGQLLASIYDELLQPLPPQLHGFLSPSDDDPNTSSVSSGRPMTSVQSEAAPSVDDLLHSQNSSRVLRWVWSFLSCFEISTKYFGCFGCGFVDAYRLH